MISDMVIWRMAYTCKVAASAAAGRMLFARSRRGPRTRALRASPRDSEGRKILEVPTFDASDPSVIQSIHPAEFGMRPFGILAYAPSASLAQISMC